MDVMFQQKFSNKPNILFWLGGKYQISEDDSLLVYWSKEVKGQCQMLGNIKKDARVMSTLNFISFFINLQRKPGRT